MTDRAYRDTGQNLWVNKGQTGNRKDKEGLDIWEISRSCDTTGVSPYWVST